MTYTDPESRPPHVGAIVLYQRPAVASDAAAPAVVPAFVLDVHEDASTVDLVVFGAGGREALARGKGIVAYRGAVPFALEPGAEPRSWRWPRL